VVTKRGQQLTGLVAEEGDSLTVLQSDASKVTLKKRDVEQRYASLVSVMPEGLEMQLTKQDVTDLIVYLQAVGTGK